MKVWKMLLIVIVIIGVFSVVSCDTREKEQNGNGTVNDYDSVTVQQITLKWKTDTLGMLHIIVSAPTTGWVSVGFDPTAGMQDANIIIGYVTSGGAFARDDYGTTPTAHASDMSGGGENNITNASGNEAEGSTEITFTIPLDSGDARDRPLTQGNTYTVILAYGADGVDDFDTRHAVRTSTRIDIQ